MTTNTQTGLQGWQNAILEITDMTNTNTQTNEQPDTLGSEWTPCRKKPIVVHVRAQRLGEQHVSTREGIAPVKPDDLIMRGVAGEEYPIGRELFDRTYDIVDGNEQPAGERAELIRELRSAFIDITLSANKANKIAALLEADAQRPALKPLDKATISEIAHHLEAEDCDDSFWVEFTRAIEAAHGIKEQA